MPVFTPDLRATLRSALLAQAASDPRISGAAITGSAAVAGEDRWSDIDLAFGIGDGAALPDVLADFTARMYEQYSAAHHLDVIAGAWTYRVFLLPNTLQVDLAFVAANEFRAMAPAFRLVAGKAHEPGHSPAPSAEALIGFAWLHALHARACLGRQRLWQAEYMIGGIRDNALALACVRHGLPAVHGRGVDELPGEVTAPWKESLVGRLDAVELSRAFRAAVKGLRGEIRATDPKLASRLERVMELLIETQD